MFHPGVVEKLFNKIVICIDSLNPSNSWSSFTGRLFKIGRNLCQALKCMLRKINVLEILEVLGKKEEVPGWRDGSAGKALAANAEDSISISGAQMVEGENRSLKVDF